MNKKFIFFIIFYFFFSFPTKSLTVELNVYYHDVPDNINIIFPGKSFRTWVLFMEEIIKNKTHIEEKYKEKFRIMGSYNFNNKEYKFSGQARLTGDWTDHIDLKRGYSSLSISLQKGNIGGITKFRLLIPITRHTYNEIFWTILINEMGFFTPHRQMILATLQGSKKKLMIFEEKPEKEFLESKGFRETPSIEFDERQNWELVKRDYKKISENLTQLKIKNTDFLKNPTSIKIAMRSLYYPFLKDEKYNQKIYKEINTPEGVHGIDEQNAKFIYDAIYNSYHPIYFDGDIHFDESNCKKNKITNIPKEINIQINLVQNKYKKLSLGKNLTEEMKCVAIKKLLLIHNNKKLEREIYPLKNFKMDQIKMLDSQNLKSIYLYTPKKIYSYKKRNPVTIIDKNLNINYCKYSVQKRAWLECEKKQFSQTEIKNILSGSDIPEEYNQQKLYPMHSFSYSKSRDEIFEKLNIKKKENFNIFVEKNQTKFIKLNSIDSNIQIFLNDDTSKIVFYNSKLQQTKINVKIISNNNIAEKDNFRFDERLLTSCITLVDSKVIDSKLNISGCNNEDSINFIRSKGSNVTVIVEKAKYDAIDADFSNIFFDKIQIKEAGNDCVDVSGGVYNIKYLNSTKCNDKAISVGEKSLVTISQLEVSNSKLVFALKDSSILHLLDGNFKNNNSCGEIYRKKQEFYSSTLYINKNIQCSVKVDNYSKIYNSNICKIANRNYFFKSCITKNNEININFENELPNNSLIKLEANLINNNNKQLLLSHKDILQKDCFSKFLNCKLNINLNEIFKNTKIKTLDVKLIDMNYGDYLTEKYIFIF